MAMLSAYMDETGDSRDERQRFNGMAGLIAPAKQWERFEGKWKQTLKEFKIPYFHMTDFANFQGPFIGWSELRRRKLLGKLLKHIEVIRPLPLGSIMSMEDYRSLTPLEQQLFEDPYYVGFGVVTGFISVVLDKFSNPSPTKHKAALVFDDKVEFRHKAMRFYEMGASTQPVIKQRTDPPAFRDMREMVPLQAADMVAYELYKEYERRRYRPQSDMRYGYKALVKMGERLRFPVPLFAFMTKADLLSGVDRMTFAQRQRDYWQNKRAKGAEES